MTEVDEKAQCYHDGWKAGHAAAQEEQYDSRVATYQHIDRVRALVLGCASDLIARAHGHDQSKLQTPEKEAFDVLSPRLKGMTYGSDEYKHCLAEMKPAIEHHYQKNDHHPEHGESRDVSWMSMIQLLEMICDWKAASERHDDGDVRKSVELNAERFGYGDEIKRLLHNTLDFLESL